MKELEPQSWHDLLTSEQKQMLFDRHPGLTLDEIAILAMQDPKYTKQFAELGARVIRPNKITIL